jgi:biotin carboxyl carrier protein
VQFELEIGGKVRTVRASIDRDRLEVSVDGRRFEVDHRAVGRHTLSLLIREGDGPARSVDATVMARPGGVGFDVSLEGQTLEAAVVTRFGRRAGEAAGQGGGPQTILAPMPGKIVRLLVAVGDAVAARQGLVVIEAMKMENELRAARAGRVQAIRVAEGQSVEAGALLVTVE